MKKLFLLLVSAAISIFTIQTLHAANATYPQLQMKIVNTIKGQNFALCLAETCYVINPGKEKTIAMDETAVNSIVMTDINNMQIYQQVIPDSCKVTVKKNQTLVVTGKIVSKKSEVLVNNLQCKITTNA